MFPDATTYGLFLLLALAGLLEMGFFLYRIKRRSDELRRYREDFTLDQYLEVAKEDVPEEFYEQQKDVLNKHVSNEAG